MSDDLWPAPISPYGLRRHLAAAHQLPLWGTGWAEMVQIHDHDHLSDVGHAHERSGR